MRAAGGVAGKGGCTAVPVFSKAGQGTSSTRPGGAGRAGGHGWPKLALADWAWSAGLTAAAAGRTSNRKRHYALQSGSSANRKVTARDSDRPRPDLPAVAGMESDSEPAGPQELQVAASLSDLQFRAHGQL
jgi:hypothetical protein